VEFAKEVLDVGLPLIQATMEAVALETSPII